MRAVKLGILADHLGFHPETDLETHAVNFPQQCVEAVGQLAQVGDPVTETAPVVVPMAEPSVVDHQHVHAKLLRLAGKAEQLVLVEVKIHGFPAVEQDWALSKGNIAAADIFTQEAVISLRERCKACRAVCQQNLRCVKMLTGLEKPGEALAVDAAHHTYRAGLIQLNICAVIAGVHRHHPAASSRILGSLRLTQNDKGIVLVAGSAAF